MKYRSKIVLLLLGILVTVGMIVTMLASPGPAFAGIDLVPCGDYWGSQECRKGSCEWQSVGSCWQSNNVWIKYIYDSGEKTHHFATDWVCYSWGCLPTCQTTCY